MRRLLLCFVGLIFCTSVTAQDFTAVRVEAENFSSKHPDWRLTTRNNTPNVNPDPDGSHASSASGGAYLELLPDTRVTHGDQLISNGNFWNTAGTGPALSYNVNIPEAGRYLVFVKAYSTGTEDNGIHVGLNNSFPASGQRIQWCSGKNKWTWSSAQRTASNHCGTERTIYLDFSFAGANTVTFTAREDGFEFDQFILLKTNNNSCRPNDNDQIACNNGTSSVPSEGTSNNPEPTPVTPPEPVEPTPAPVETPEPVVSTPVATQPEPAPVVSVQSGVSTTAVCTSTAADPDGDGWGWENNQSCTVAGFDTQAPAASTGTPVCSNTGSDPDGDGWGWENNQSCTIAGFAVQVPATVEESPVCVDPASDPDGDGWGWENGVSCRVN